MMISNVSFSSSNRLQSKKPVAKEPTKQTTTTTPEKKIDFPGNPYAGMYHRSHALNPEQKFDYHFATGAKLKNGATIIKPVVLSLGNVEISKEENGNYTVRTSVSENRLTISEEELKNTKWLYRGAIKQMDENKFILDYTDKNGNTHFVEADKTKAIEILNENMYYM